MDKKIEILKKLSWAKGYLYLLEIMDRRINTKFIALTLEEIEETIQLNTTDKMGNIISIICIGKIKYIEGFLDAQDCDVLQDNHKDELKNLFQSVCEEVLEWARIQ